LWTFDEEMMTNFSIILRLLWEIGNFPDAISLFEGLSITKAMSNTGFVGNDKVSFSDQFWWDFIILYHRQGLICFSFTF